MSIYYTFIIYIHVYIYIYIGVSRVIEVVSAIDFYSAFDSFRFIYYLFDLFALL